MDKNNFDHIEVVIDSQKKLGKELVDDPHVDLDLIFKQEINDWVIQNPPPELSEGVIG